MPFTPLGMPTFFFRARLYRKKEAMRSFSRFRLFASQQQGGGACATPPPAIVEEEEVK